MDNLEQILRDLIENLDRAKEVVFEDADEAYAHSNIIARAKEALRPDTRWEGAEDLKYTDPVVRTVSRGIEDFCPACQKKLRTHHRPGEIIEVCPKCEHLLFRKD